MMMDAEMVITQKSLFLHLHDVPKTHTFCNHQFDATAPDKMNVLRVPENKD